MSFKNLKSPASNSPEEAKPPVTKIPADVEPTVNDEPVNKVPDGPAPIKWPAAQFDGDNPAGGGNRPPMKNLKSG